jgi:uncharacterized membrane protein
MAVNWLNDVGPMGLVFFILPLVTIVISVILQIVIKKKLIVIGIVFIAYLIATFVFFNSTFIVWCFVYTVISLIGTLIGDLIIKHRKKSV